MQDRESDIRLNKGIGMGITIFRKNKRRGKEIATMGYGKFNHISDVFMSCWNPEFAFLCDNHLFLEKDIFFEDATPPLPDELLAFVSQSDCEGEMKADEVAALVRVLEQNETFMQRKSFPTITRVVGHLNVCHDNLWMNDPKWREEAHKFYLLLKNCAQRKCGIEWS